MKHKLSLFLLLCVVVSSCQNELVQENRTQPRKASVIDPKICNSRNLGMPFTEPDELERLTENNENVIDYRIARYLATIELLAGANFALVVDPNAEWCLTPYPKVVYNYDRTPKYYEYGYSVLHDNGSDNAIVATIVTYAQKETAGSIAYVFPKPLSQEYGDFDYYVGKMYPERYYGYESPEYYYDSWTHELKSIDFEFQERGTDEDLLQFMFSDMEPSDFYDMEQDLDEEEGITIDEYQNVYRQEVYDYWQQIDEFFNEYSEALYLSCEELIQFHNAIDYQNYRDQVYELEDMSAYYTNQLLEELDYMLRYFDNYILPEYSDPQLQVTYWSGYCGPAACSWVYRGKYDSFRGKYLPLFLGDEHDYFECDYGYLYAQYNFRGIDVTGLSREAARNKYIERSDTADYGLAACFYQESVPVWWGKWQFPLYHGGLNRGFDTATDGEYKVKFTCCPYDWIVSKNEPVIIEINCDHYIVAFGTGTTHKKNGKIKDKYFAIADNGYTTGAYNYHPYMRKHNGWNLHYGMKRKD